MRRAYIPQEVLDAINAGTFQTVGVGHATVTLRSLRTAFELIATWTIERPEVPIFVKGDPGSFVPPETIKELVALAKVGRRDDFLFLADASGVPEDQRDELWAGTRARLGVSP